VTNTSKHENAGTVTILPSNGTKITTTGAQFMHQDTAGVPAGPARAISSAS
jgi:hypothetical protein